MPNLMIINHYDDALTVIARTFIGDDSELSVSGLSR